MEMSETLHVTVAWFLGKEFPVSTGWEAQWGAGLYWALLARKKFLATDENRIPAIQPAPYHYTY
jgi:hypothetical protein